MENCPKCNGTGCASPVDYEGCPIPCDCHLSQALIAYEEQALAHYEKPTVTRYHLVEMLSEATEQHKVEQVELNSPIFDLESVLATLDPAKPINHTAIAVLKRELAYLNMCLALSDKMLEATKAEIRMQCTEDEYISILKEVEQVG